MLHDGLCVAVVVTSGVAGAVGSIFGEDGGVFVSAAATDTVVDAVDLCAAMLREDGAQVGGQTFQSSFA